MATNPLAGSIDPNNADMVALAQRLLGEDITKQGVVQNLTPAQINLLKSEETAKQARSTDPRGLWTSADAIQGMNDAALITQLGEIPYEQALTAADKFAAATSWRLYPTTAQLNEMVYSGVDTTDAKAVAKYLGNLAPPDIKERMPWITTGLSQGVFTDTVSQLQAHWKTMTGDESSFSQFTPDQLAQFASNPGGLAAVDTQWKEDPAIQSKYAWVKQGMSYDTFKQNYIDNPAQRMAVIARFGSAAADDTNAYIQQLDNPLQGPPGGTSGGGKVTEGSPRTQQNFSGRTNVG
jgi:hypothetical protein